MVTNYLTISEICKATDISNSSCRRYLNEFAEFFSVKGGSRVKKYEEQAVNVIGRIKYLYDEGKDKDEIYNVLVSEFPLVVNDDEEQKSKETVPGLATSEDIAEIKESLEEQKKFNAELLKRLDQQAEYIKSSIDKRDKLLTESMNSLIESKQEVAAGTEKEEKKGVFARLFGK